MSTRKIYRQKDRHMDRIKPICLFNFFEAGDINKNKLVKNELPYTASLMIFIKLAGMTDGHKDRQTSAKLHVYAPFTIQCLVGGYK